MIMQRRYILAGALIVSCLIFAIFFFRSKQFHPAAAHAPLHNEKIKGPEDAPITIVEFSDFQCPSCAKSQTPLKKFLGQFPNLIKVHFRYFPLPMHRAAFDAALSAECAAEQLKFWPYQEMLFQEQETWSHDPDPRALFMAYANSVGIERNSYQKCVGDPKITQAVENDRQSGETLQVSSTPTFFINGERLVGSKQLEEQGAGVIQKQLEAMVVKKGKN